MALKITELMHAFLFDAHHPDVNDLWAFGPPCTSRVVAAAERLPSLKPMRLIRGKIIPESICYDLGGFVVHGTTEDALETSGDDQPSSGSLLGMRHVSLSPGSARADQINYEPDEERFKTVICDLAETLSAQPSTVNEQELLVRLAQGLVWAVAPSGLADEQALIIDAELREFGPYLGMAKLDLGNVTHRQIMIEDMHHEDVVLGPGGITYRIEHGLPEEDRHEAMFLAEELGSGRPPALLEEDEFEEILPPLNYPARPSERGELSRQRVAGKMEMSHRERLGRALLEHFEGLQDGERVSFSTAREEGVSEFHFPPEKFTRYLLNLDHPEGRGKALLFVNELGIQPNDWRFLASQIEQAMATAPIYRAGKNAQGFTHGAYVLVNGRTGKTLVLETGWILEPGQPARFVTAYPAKAELAAELNAPTPIVVEPSLTGDQRWAETYRIAHAAGEKAASAAQPTPMVVEGHGTEWEGLCGFGWAQLPNGRHPMAKWLVRNNHGYSTSPGVRVPSPVRTQSLDRNRAYAEAFATVLRANEVECSVGSRLD